MDYFFAQIEELRHLEYKDKIIVVCVYSGRTDDSGVVSTVNYAGRKHGVYSGMPIVFAKKKLASLDSLFLPINRQYYEKISSDIGEIIRKYSDQVAQLSIDEWNLNVPQIPEETARAIKKEIKEKIGLTCSIGIASSLTGAKMAAQKNKPDGLVILDKKQEKKLIDNSFVESVPGIGSKTAEILKEMEVIKVKDLRKLSAMELVDNFGRKTGAWLHDLSQSNYNNRLEEETEQTEVSKIATLKHETRDSYILMLTIAELEKQAKQWLEQHKKFYKTLTIIFITDDMKTHTKSFSFRNPRKWNEENSGEEITLVNVFLKENKRLIRRVGVRFSHFVDMQGQTTLG